MYLVLEWDTLFRGGNKAEHFRRATTRPATNHRSFPSTCLTPVVSQPASRPAIWLAANGEAHSAAGNQPSQRVHRSIDPSVRPARLNWLAFHISTSIDLVTPKGGTGYFSIHQTSSSFFFRSIISKWHNHERQIARVSLWMHLSLCVSISKSAVTSGDPATRSLGLHQPIVRWILICESRIALQSALGRAARKPHCV